ncbi:MAG TPA: MarR family transcriptional regulator [Rhizomicrobium sp.]|jgi:MarR family transcriptional regulator, transcriptional regulator for hemolysin|nr:MarR family transcriptional regulator [Rhizomicrobium sp.]
MAPPFEQDLMIVLNDVARLVRTRFDQRARAFGMTRAQWVILARLNRQPGLSQNEMAAICEVEPITVGRLIDRLEARGFVERRADPADRRIRRLHLLPAAKPLLEDIALYRDELHEQIVVGVAGQDYEKLVETLLQIKDNLTADPNPKLAMAGE